MITKIRKKLISLYQSVVSSIAFLPSVIALSFLLFALILVALETNGLSKYLRENTSLWIISNVDTARAILSTLIGGIISLMVFSFSMVMVLLNQASSNFSPRLLPGLITDKRNQVVLGFYLGTIIYNIIVLIVVLPSGEDQNLKGFSVLLGIIFGICCLAFFIYFIHGISNSIQINNILEKVYGATKDRLEVLIKQEQNALQFPFTNLRNWHNIYNKEAGYLRGIDLSRIQKFASENSTHIKILPYKGKYILPNESIILTEKSLDDEQQEKLKDYLLFGGTGDPEDNYILGIKQIAEVGVKAMSPGINDPGTAIMTIDYITELLALRMQLGDMQVHLSEKEDFYIVEDTIDFKKLLHTTLISYRQYVRHDFLLMEKLIYMLQYLKSQKMLDPQYEDDIDNELKLIKMDIDEHITNSKDSTRLCNMVDNCEIV